MPLLDVDRARENVARHTWAQAILEGWKQQVAYLMEQDRGFIEAMMPELTPWPQYGQNCPVCVNRLSTMGETGIYDWDPRDPDRLVCKYCQTEYPSPDHPETGSVTAPRMGQTFTFYLTDEERAHPEDSSGRHAFKWVNWPVHTSWTGIIRSMKINWCFEKMLPLAKLYALTGDVRYARWSAWILDCVARRYPTWLFHSYDGTVADCPPGEAAASMGRHPPGGRFPPETIITAFEGRHRNGDHSVLNNGFWGAGRLGCSGSDGRAILSVTLAHDLIRAARHADGSPVITPQMDRRIVDDLILAGWADTENWNDINNKCGPGRALSAAAGILFEKPESVRRAIQGLEALLEDAFHFDGFCTESPGYSSMHLNLLRDIPELLTGYSDPEGYVPESGPRLEDLDPFQRFDRYRLALESMVRMLDPNLQDPVIGDSHDGQGIDPIHAEVLAAHYGSRYAGLLEKAQGAPLSQKGSEYALWHRDPDLKAAGETDLPRRTEWFPGWHVAVLRGGNPDGHSALYLNGYACGGHRHCDSLGLIYIAHGREMAADRGYIWDDPRNAWTGSTLSHNIVTVDGKSQMGHTEAAALELFGAGAGVEVVQASARQYEQCGRYQRTCVLVRIPEGSHIRRRLLPRRRRPAAPVRLPLQRPTRGPSRDGPGASGRGDRMAPEPARRPAATALHRHLAQRGGADGPHPPQSRRPPARRRCPRLALGHRRAAPRPARAADPGRAPGRDGPGQPLRRRDHPLHRPVPRSRRPAAAGRSCHRRPGRGRRAGGLHRLHPLRTGRGPPATWVRSPSTGRFGFASVDDEGILRRAFLLCGTSLRGGGRSLRPDQAQIRRGVASVEGRTFHLTEGVPEAESLPGTWLLAADTGYEVESASERSITVRDYPAVPCEEIRLLEAAALVEEE